MFSTETAEHLTKMFAMQARLLAYFEKGDGGELTVSAKTVHSEYKEHKDKHNITTNNGKHLIRIKEEQLLQRK